MTFSDLRMSRKVFIKLGDLIYVQDCVCGGVDVYVDFVLPRLCCDAPTKTEVLGRLGKCSM